MEREQKESWLFGLTVCAATATLVSIAVSEILGAAACLLWVVFRPKRVYLPRYVLPLVALMIATLISLALSPDPHRGMSQINKFVLFPMGLLAANFVLTPERVKLSYRFLLVAAAASSIVAIIQFVLAYLHFMETGLLADDPTILDRAKGFMSHWITFSVGEMLVWCAAVPIVVFLGRRWFLPTILIGAAIVLSFTRGVWIGSAVGLLAIAPTLSRKQLATVIAPVAVVALLAAWPIFHRVSTSADPGNGPVYGRFALWEAGARMVSAHPFFGVGPDRIGAEFPRYNTSPIDLKTFFYGHMENNFMQIAAERGLIALGAFIWFLAELFVGLWRLLGSDREMVRTAALSALAALIGFLVAGLFSYDFGDSETLLLFLFIVSVPFGLARATPSPA